MQVMSGNSKLGLCIRVLQKTKAKLQTTDLQVGIVIIAPRARLEYRSSMPDAKHQIHAIMARDSFMLSSLEGSRLPTPSAPLAAAHRRSSAAP